MEIHNKTEIKQNTKENRNKTEMRRQLKRIHSSVTEVKKYDSREEIFS